MDEKEPEIYKYKMDRITYTKPNYDKYDMNINLYSKFKNENIKLFENDNVKESKKYDNVDEIKSDVYKIPNQLIMNSNHKTVFKE